MEPVWAMGLMSGTSLDGIDAALIRTDGVEIAEFGPGAELPYAEGGLPAVRAVHADWRPYLPARGEAERRRLAQAEAEVTEAHAAAAARLLCRPEAAGSAPEIVGFHGQTVAHAPDEGWTWQLGDGAALARGLNRTVAWDFRSADMAAGGQGAPLAPVYHFALGRRLGRGPICFLNLGGVGNVSWVDPEAEGPEAPGALIGFDTGPANALVDDWMRARTGESCDRDGAAAAAGRVHDDRLQRNSISDFVARRPPKSLDRNTFAQALEAMHGLSTEDGAATLTALSALCAAGAQAHLPRPAATWILCGGGRRNPTLSRMIAERVEAEVIPAEDAGFDGDLIEAQCFAYLAVRSLRGLPLSAPAVTGVPSPTRGGRISRP